MEQDQYAEKIVAAVVKRLADEREAQGMSKNRLATLAGIDPKTVAFVENRERNPTLFTLVKMAQALGAELAEYLQEAERK